MAEEKEDAEVKLPDPVVRALISIQSAWPSYGTSVKSSEASMRPALTDCASSSIVSIAVPSVAEVKSPKRKS